MKPKRNGARKKWKDIDAIIYLQGAYHKAVLDSIDEILDIGEPEDDEQKRRCLLLQRRIRSHSEKLIRTDQELRKLVDELREADMKKSEGLKKLEKEYEMKRRTLIKALRDGGCPETGELHDEVIALRDKFIKRAEYEVKKVTGMEL